MLNKLNGWVRLWLVGVVLVAIASAWTCLATLPEGPGSNFLERSYAYSVRLNNELEQAQAGSHSGRSVEEVQAEINQMRADVAVIYKSYRDAQFKHKVNYFLIWLGGAVALAVLLFATHWIVRGFRKQPA